MIARADGETGVSCTDLHHLQAAQKGFRSETDSLVETRGCSVQKWSRNVGHGQEDVVQT